MDRGPGTVRAVHDEAAGGAGGDGVVLAVDVGGTKLAAAVVTRGGAVLARRSVPTPQLAGGADGGGTPGPPGDPAAAAALWSTVTRLVADVRAAPEAAGRPVLACGAGCGGPMAPGGEDVSPLHIPAWRGFPLRARLAELAGAPAFVDNDAKALARGEGRFGAARGVRDYLAMVVSTGVGGGIVLDGRLLEGAAGNAGHIGHVIVEPDGRPCPCGGRGCLEGEASGPAIAAATGTAPAAAPPEVRRRTGALVGRAVASVANLLDLRLAVVGGSVALGFGDDFFRAAAAEVAARSRLSFSAGTRVVPPLRGDEAPLLGAAAVAWHALDPT